MSYSKLFICFMLCTVGFSTKTIAQSLYNPSLNPKNTATLIIDSIPVVNTQKYRLAGIDEPSNDYRLFFGSSFVSNQYSFGISRTRPFVVVQNKTIITYF